MKKIKILPLLLIVCLLFSVTAPSAAAVDDPDVSAKEVVLADIESGSILFSRNMNDKAAPASLTKIMTVLLAVEAIERGETTLDTVVTAQSDCQQGLSEDSSTVNITAGEQLSLESLLYCAMVHSANEACNVIASHISGSISSFVDLMNQRAAELGCTGTHFANTNGLPDDNHYTTAYDIYLIALEAVKHPLFMTICNTSTYTVPATNYAGERVLSNSNALISSDSIYGSGYIYEYAAGVKTGFTRAAGNCLISTAEKDDLHLIAIVMGCDGPNNSDSTEDYLNFVDTITLYDWAFAHFAYRTILSSSDVVTQTTIDLAEGDGTVGLRPDTGITVLVPDDLSDDDIKLSITLYEEKLVAPIDAGDVLGEAEVYAGTTDCGRVKLVSTAAVELSRSQILKQHLQRIFGNTFVRVLLIIIFIFAAAYIALYTRYRYLRRKHLRKKREAEQRRRVEQQTARRHRKANSQPDSFDDEPLLTRLDPSERNGQDLDVNDVLNRK